jgi:hypothetical protein
MSDQFKKSFEKFAVEEKDDLKLEDEYLELEDEDKVFPVDEQVASHESLKSEGLSIRDPKKLSSSTLKTIPEETSAEKFWNDAKSGDGSYEKLSDVEIELVDRESDEDALEETIENIEPPKEMEIEIPDNQEDIEDEPLFEESEVSEGTEDASASLRMSSEDSEKNESTR